MKKVTKQKVKKTVTQGARRAEQAARVVTGNVIIVGRGIVRGVKQGVKDAQSLNRRSTRKP